MPILVTGAVGMIGRKLTESFVERGGPGGQRVDASFDDIVRIHVEDELWGRV
ncbi:hypothetical protein [Roseiarcus sp.]|uniref:hypothetical protein n=1 Tax=Roseiarcus sp. TaxID=1969460 RepID=UPI003F98E0EE